MRSFISWTVGVGLLCWGICSTLSLLSELHIVVDGLNWSISHVSVSLKTVLLEIGKRVSETVSEYRALVRGMARLLHLPRLPSFVYDVIGVVTFSIRRGYWLGERDAQAVDEMHALYPIEEGPWPGTEEWKVWAKRYDRFYRKHPLRRWYNRHSRRWPFPDVVSSTLVYGGSVAIILSVLFGIDYVYRHFAA
jgi:hypothetical protein